MTLWNTMPFEEWVRMVHVMLVDLAPALAGSLVEPIGSSVAPTWQGKHGFVAVSASANQERSTARFVKMFVPPLPFVRLDGGEASRTYAHTEVDGNRAAAEFAGFLLHGNLPESEREAG